MVQSPTKLMTCRSYWIAMIHLISTRHTTKASSKPSLYYIDINRSTIAKLARYCATRHTLIRRAWVWHGCDFSILKSYYTWTAIDIYLNLQKQTIGYTSSLVCADKLNLSTCDNVNRYINWKRNTTTINFFSSICCILNKIFNIISFLVSISVEHT